jgi:hypothetical protein
MQKKLNGNGKTEPWPIVEAVRVQAGGGSGGKVPNSPTWPNKPSSLHGLHGIDVAHSGI